MFSLIGAAPVTAAENGDLIIPGPEPERMEPLGDGVYRSTNGPSRIAFRDVEGRMRMYDFAGLAPMERIGFLQSPAWLGLIAGLGAIVALWGVIAGARRIFARKKRVPR